MVSFDQTVFFNLASECKMQLTLETFKTLPSRAYYQGHHQKLHTQSLPSAAQCTLYTCTMGSIYMYNGFYIHVQWVLSAQAKEYLKFVAHLASVVISTWPGH